jgi:hypothetical protein
MIAHRNAGPCEQLQRESSEAAICLHHASVYISRFRLVLRLVPTVPDSNNHILGNCPTGAGGEVAPAKRRELVSAALVHGPHAVIEHRRGTLGCGTIMTDQSSCKPSLSGKGGGAVKSELLESSADAAQRAIEHYLNRDVKRFLIEAAVSTELLGKALLVGIHPVLIAASSDFDLILALCSHPSARSRSDIRTIGAKEVVKRVAVLTPEFKRHAEEFNELADLRNSLVHMGQMPPVDVDYVFNEFASGSEILIKACGMSRDAHWGRFADVVARLLDASLPASQRTFAKRIESSREVFQRRHGHLTDEQLPAVLAAEMPFGFTALLNGWLADATLKPCPSCSQPGILKGELTTVYKPNEEISDPAILEKEPWLAEIIEGTLQPTAFVCPFCELKIEDRDELVAAGLAAVETSVYTYQLLGKGPDASVASDE